MPLLPRIKYALYLFVAITMAVLLALSIGEGLGMIRGLDIQGLPFNLAYVLPTAVACFVLAPAASRLVPLPGTAPAKMQQAESRPFGFAVRVAGLLALGIVLLLAVKVVLWLFGHG